MSQYLAPQCEYCGKEYSSGTNLKYHIQAIHLNARNIICSFCYERFLNETDLRTHVNNLHNKGNLFECSECKASFPNFTKLVQHKDLIHYNDVKSFQCGNCLKTFSSLENLNLHLNFICKGKIKQENVEIYGQNPKETRTLKENPKAKVLTDR